MDCRKLAIDPTKHLTTPNTAFDPAKPTKYRLCRLEYVWIGSERHLKFTLPLDGRIFNTREEAQHNIGAHAFDRCTAAIQAVNVDSNNKVVAAQAEE